MLGLVTGVFSFPIFHHLYFAIWCKRNSLLLDDRITWNIWSILAHPCPWSLFTAALEGSHCSYLSVARQPYRLWPTSGERTSDLTQIGGKREFSLVFLWESSSACTITTDPNFMSFTTFYHVSIFLSGSIIIVSCAYLLFAMFVVPLLYITSAHLL